MNKPFNYTLMMMKSLFNRGKIKYLWWVLGVLLYAASGAGKFEAAMIAHSTKAASMFTLFQNPTMVTLFGPTSVKSATAFNVAATFGGIMLLMTVVVFAIVSIVYVVNRTRKDEDEGIAELLRSFQIDNLANKHDCRCHRVIPASFGDYTGIDRDNCCTKCTSYAHFK